MFENIPQNLVLYCAAAFFIGWILSAISSRMTSGSQGSKGDPRDGRIRSLEAELRVSTTETEKARDAGDNLEAELKAANEGIEKRDGVISHQQQQIDELKGNLKGSIKKTRELRSELTDRATENIKSEVKLREVETELEVAQVSADLIATGVLDYSLAEEFQEEESDGDVDDADLGKAAT